MNRRACLFSIGIVAMGGCTVQSGDSNPASDPNRNPPGSKTNRSSCEKENQLLPDILVKNSSADAKSVQVEVFKGDEKREKIFSREYDVPGNEEEKTPIAFEEAHRDSPEPPYFAEAGTDDEESVTTQVTSTVAVNPLRYGIQIEIMGYGGLTLEERHVDVDSEWTDPCA